VVAVDYKAGIGLCGPSQYPAAQYGKRLVSGVSRGRPRRDGSARDPSPILNRASPVSRHCGVYRELNVAASAAAL
jgi:hypothetical protein